MKKLIIGALYLGWIIAGYQAASASPMGADDAETNRPMLKTASGVVFDGTGARVDRNNERAIVALRDGGWHDTRARTPEGKNVPRERADRQEGIDSTSGSDQNLMAVLAVGLGIALISIVRRITRY